MFPRTGYYIVEKKKLGQIPSESSVMSFIEFMRRVKNKDVSGQIFVHGFEEAARVWGDLVDFVRYMRISLRPLAQTLFMNGGIIIFPVDGTVIGNARSVVKYHDLEIELAGIFGADRIEQQNGQAYSPPNIA